jgi:hypothetical protein
MAPAKHPYQVPSEFSANLRRVLTYWESLKRGHNNIPFWDDVNLTALPDLNDRLLLVDVFDKPERFRFNFVGKEFAKGHSDSLVSKFADDTSLVGALSYFRSQASATVEASEPTFYRRDAFESGPAFSRLLMPMWGDGRIGMLLGALDLQHGSKMHESQP